MATSIDDNAADENLYKLFGEMSVIQYTRTNSLNCNLKWLIQHLLDEDFAIYNEIFS